MNNLPEQQERIVLAALQLPLDERAAYIEKACGTDTELHRAVTAAVEACDETLEPIRLPASIISMLEKPGDRIGRYKLLQQIGEGGCGVVYMAEQETPVRRRVALKVIKLGMDTRQVVARFEAERQALALMDHPNIARVLDGGATDAGRPYFVMELVRGVKITEYCDQHNLSTHERLSLFVQICRAIQHAHQKGIIHRDIKPSNILVTLQDGMPVPKVIDFGIAKATEQPLTEKTLFTAFEQFIGTPAYMSPEQAEVSGLDIDTRSDVYSLGVLLYELLTGHTPLEARDLVDAGLEGMRRMIREKDPLRPSTRLSTLAPDEQTTVARRRKVEPPKLIHLVRGDLDWIVMRCLEKDRTRRYDTANGLALEIERFLNNEPVSARPPSNVYRFQKLVRRNKLVFAAATCVALALVSGLTVSVWESSRAREAERAALNAQHRENHQRVQAEEAARQAQTQRERAQASDLAAREQLYSSRINLGHRMWEEGEMARMQELLQSLQPKPGEEDLRGFEWYYLTNLLHPEMRLLSGGAQIRAVAFSPEAAMLASAGSDVAPRPEVVSSNRILVGVTNMAKIAIWDLRSERIVRSLSGHLGYVNSLAFSPDGSLLVSGGKDSTAKVWRVADGELMLNLSGASNEVACVAFSPDSNIVAVATGRPRAGFGSNQRTRIFEPSGRMDEILLFEIPAGRLLRRIPAHKDGVSSLAFSPGGEFVASVGEDGQIRLWDTASGRLQQAVQTPADELFCVAISPDSQSIVAGTGGGSLIVWQPLAGTLKRIETRHDTIFSLCFSPDGRTLASGGYDRVVRLWGPSEVEAGTWVEKAALRSHTNIVWSLSFAPHGKLLASGAWDGSTRIWDLTKPQDCAYFETGDLRGSILSMDFSHDGKLIATAANRIHLWDSATLRRVNTLDRFSGSISRESFSSDGRWIAAINTDGVISVWTNATWQQQFSLTNQGYLWGLAFSPDGNTLVTANRSGEVKCWSIPEGKLKRTLSPLMDQITSIAFTPNGATLAVNGRLAHKTGRAIHLWRWPDLSSFEPLDFQYSGPVLFSPDSSLLFLASGDDGAVQIRDARNFSLRASAKSHSDLIWGTAVSGDGKTFASASWDGSVRLWHVQTGAELFALKGYVGKQCFSVAFSPSCRQLTVGGVARGTSLVSFNAYKSETTPDRSLFVDWRSRWIGAYRELALANLPLRLNNLAWNMATSTNAQTRDGSNAVFQAERAVLLTRRTNSMFLDTLAAAHAEAGDFTNARAVQKEAMTLVTQEVLRDYASRMKLYELGLPFHQGEPPGWGSQQSANAFARKGQWNEAIQQLESAIALQPQEHTYYHQLAPLLVEVGDLDRYRECCRRASDLFHTTTDPTVAHRMSKDCSILPNSGIDAAVITGWADFAAVKDTNSLFFKSTKAMAAYRRGDFFDALQSLTEIERKLPDSRSSNDWLLLQVHALKAMAYHRANQPEAAGRDLAAALEMEKYIDSSIRSGDLGPGWLDWLIGRALCREAKSLILRPPTPASG